VLPLQFVPGESAHTYDLTGQETFDILGISDGMTAGQAITVRAQRPDGGSFTFQVRSRIDTPVEVEYYRNGGILQTVLRNMVKESQ
jgi:aconitate hydratase